jgi:hypothetical protein
MVHRIRRFIRANGIIGSLKAALQRRVDCYPRIQQALAQKSALEIGGPSRVFSRVVPVYRDIGSLDNCVFSNDTIWANLAPEFRYGTGRVGKNFFRECSNLSGLGEYDAILSSHTLEHLANPVKALREWRRIAPHLLLVVPNYLYTFDHRRPPTSISHMLYDFDCDVGEDDSTHFQEIIELTDLSRGPEASTKEQLVEDVTKNFKTRCLHHHVFDQHNSRELLETVGYDVITLELAHPAHIVIFAHRN